MVRLPYLMCGSAHKRRYDSQVACLYDNMGKVEPRAYRCNECGGWHLTRNDNKFTRRRTKFGQQEGGVLLYQGMAAKGWAA